MAGFCESMRGVSVGSFEASRARAYSEGSTPPNSAQSWKLGGLKLDLDRIDVGAGEDDSWSNASLSTVPTPTDLEPKSSWGGDMPDKASLRLTSDLLRRMSKHLPDGQDDVDEEPCGKPKLLLPIPGRRGSVGPPAPAAGCVEHCPVAAAQDIVTSKPACKPLLLLPSACLRRSPLAVPEQDLSVDNARPRCLRRPLLLLPAACLRGEGVAEEEEVEAAPAAPRNRPKLMLPLACLQTRMQASESQEEADEMEAPVAPRNRPKVMLPLACLRTRTQAPEGQDDRSPSTRGKHDVGAFFAPCQEISKRSKRGLLTRRVSFAEGGALEEVHEVEALVCESEPGSPSSADGCSFDSVEDGYVGLSAFCI